MGEVTLPPAGERDQVDLAEKLALAIVAQPVDNWGDALDGGIASYSTVIEREHPGLTAIQREICCYRLRSAVLQRMREIVIASAGHVGNA